LTVIAFTRSVHAAATAGAAASVALALWLLLVGTLAVATRPRNPDANPPTSDLGPEPPALANMLANGWRVRREAVPATLLDLAARGYVSIEQVASGRDVVRVRDRPTEGLLPYEMHVLAYVRSLARDGVVPAAALTTGPQEESRSWWNSFKHKVVADARKRGLARRRWSRGHMIAMVGAAFVPAVLIATALTLLPSESSSSKDDNAIEGMVAVTGAAWFVLSMLPAALNANRETPDGMRAAAVWLGLREYLQENQAVGDQPPAGVAVWERYLAYGVALGVAATAARALPMGVESDRLAWSAYGGPWRAVHITYPWRFPLGWGKKPSAAALAGAAGVLAWSFALLTLGRALLEDIGDFLPDLDIVKLIATLTFLAIFLVMLGGFVVTATFLIGGLGDLNRRETKRGVVLRMRKKEDRPAFIAIDDGSARELRAYKLESLPSGISQGDVVDITVSPKLGYVYDVSPARLQPERE
jgi:hypothetical protein